LQTIIDCPLGKTYIVKKLHTAGMLRQRLVSFGILKGAKIQYLAHTALKGTHEIQVGKTTIALRKQEAMNIEVENEPN